MTSLRLHSLLLDLVSSGLVSSFCKPYPCELSLTTLTCFWGLVEAAILFALFMEWGNPNPIWFKQFYIIIYTHRSGFAAGNTLWGYYYIMGVVNKEKGPVYYSSFNPLGTVTVAIMVSLALATHMYGSMGKKKDKPPYQSSKCQNQAPDDEEMTTNRQQMGG
ncbi:hypothetical protein ACFX2I_028319 [Malus domestica]